MFLREIENGRRSMRSVTAYGNGECVKFISMKA